MSTLATGGAATRGAARPRAVVAGLSLSALTAAALSLSAGLVHFVYVPDHMWVWVPYGVCFLAAGLLQSTLATLLVLRRVGPWTAAAGIALNLGIIGVYVVSRTQYGAPFGPMRGHAELPGTADMATTIGEFVTVVALLAFLPRRVRGWATTLLLVAGAYLWWLRLTNRLAY